MNYQHNVSYRLLFMNKLNTEKNIKSKICCLEEKILNLENVLAKIQILSANDYRQIEGKFNSYFNDISFPDLNSNDCVIIYYKSPIKDLIDYKTLLVYKNNNLIKLEFKSRQKSIISTNPNIVITWQWIVGKTINITYDNDDQNNISLNDQYYDLNVNDKLNKLLEYIPRLEIEHKNYIIKMLKLISLAYNSLNKNQSFEYQILYNLN